MGDGTPEAVPALGGALQEHESLRDLVKADKHDDDEGKPHHVRVRPGSGLHGGESFGSRGIEEAFRQHVGDGAETQEKGARGDSRCGPRGGTPLPSGGAEPQKRGAEHAETGERGAGGDEIVEGSEFAGEPRADSHEIICHG